MSEYNQEKKREQLWSAVDAYIGAHLIPADATLEETLKANRAAELPEIDVAPHEGKLLHLLARMQGAKRILEIGTLGGYSTIWLARALPPDGRLYTLEFSPKHAAVAGENIARAGLSRIVEQRVGPALDSLARMHSEGVEPFDFIFIDADKPNNPNYLDWAMRFAHPGTVIVVDNVIREGGLIDANHPDPRVHGNRQMFEKIQGDPRLEATAVQTVGAKGHDGFALILVKSL